MIVWSAHLSMLFRELPYLARPAAARAAGFSTVETWWPPEGLGSAWAEEVRRLGLAVASINCEGGSIEAGERGFLNLPDHREASLAAFEAAVSLVGAAGGRRINLLVGREAAGTHRARQLADATAVLSECAAIAEAARVSILIEPINELDVPGYLVPTPRSAEKLIQKVGSRSVRLLYDAYHAARAGGDPEREIPSLIDLIGHVQYADCPGRGAPGTGRLSLEALVETLEGCGYEGAVGLEFDPRGPTPDALASLPPLPGR